MTDILDQFTGPGQESRKRNQLFKITIALSLVYIIAFAIFCWTYLRSFRHLPTVAYLAVLILVLLLCILLILFIRKTKTGWAMNLAWFLFMSIFMLSSLSKKFIQHETINFQTFTDFRTNLFFALQALITTLLLTRPMRSLFNISRPLLTVTLVATLLLAIVFIPVLTR